ncbi:MAG: hypothetical protein HYZ46_01030 [Nitrosomonadales bacterium]|nr:hypothetical protein [Nitrosomonadales bacterium]
MRNLVISMLLCVPLLVACGTTEPAFGQPGARVVKDAFAPEGVYTFNFKRDDVYITDLARIDAVQRYLNLHQVMLPPACVYGFEVLDVVDGEAGKSAAIFKCIKPDRKMSESAPDLRGKPKGQAGLPKMLPPPPLSVPF